MFAADNQGAFVLGGFVISRSLAFVSGLPLSPTFPSVHGAFSDTSENNWLHVLGIFFMFVSEMWERGISARVPR